MPRTLTITLTDEDCTRLEAENPDSKAEVIIADWVASRLRGLARQRRLDDFKALDDETQTAIISANAKK